jgi:hypothetical protein
MALLALQQIGAAGSTVTTSSAAAGGDTVALPTNTDDRCFLQVTTSGTATNVTIADPGVTSAGNPGTTTAVALGATATKLIALPPGAVNTANGLVSIAYSAVTGVSVAALRR